jgi:hypothetical protein
MLPKAEHATPEWQTAMAVLIYVATRGGAIGALPGSA